MKLETTLESLGFSWTPAGAGEKGKPERIALSMLQAGGTGKEEAKALAALGKFLASPSASELLTVAIVAAGLEGAPERTTWQGVGRLTGGAWKPAQESGAAPAYRLVLTVTQRQEANVGALQALRHRMSVEGTSDAAVALEPFQGQLFEDTEEEAEDG